MTPSKLRDSPGLVRLLASVKRSRFLNGFFRSLLVGWRHRLSSSWGNHQGNAPKKDEYILHEATLIHPRMLLCSQSWKFVTILRVCQKSSAPASSVQ